MTRRRRAHLVRLLLFVSIPLGLGLATSALVPTGVRDVLIDPDGAARQIESLPRERRFEAAMGYGHLCGRLFDLEQIGARARALQPAERVIFLDGAGHAWTPESDGSAQVAQEVTDALAPELRPYFVDAAAMQRTRDDPDRPDAVMAWVGDLEARSGIDASNGVRIGFQQARGEDLEQALSAVAAWPPRMWIPMAEELGWRVGDQSRLAELPALMSMVPPEAACSVAQGAARGATLRRTEEGLEVGVLRQVLVETLASAGSCAEHVRLGMAWGLHLRLDGSPAAPLLAQLGDPGTTAMSARLLGRGPLGPPWADPASLR